MNLFYFQAKVKHLPTTFMTDEEHVKITGFKKQDLKDGQPFFTVKTELEAKLRNKLVVTQGGYNDFAAFDIIPGNYHTFDLQSKFRQLSTYDRFDKPVTNP